MKKLIVIPIALLAAALVLVTGCAPGYYYPPNYVEVVVIDAPDIPDCGGDWVESPSVVQTPARDRPLSKSTAPAPRTKTPRSNPTRGEGSPRIKGGRGR